MSEQRGGPAESMADLLRDDPMFSHGVNGAPIQRQRTCECGAAFVQTQLSARFLKIVEKHSAGAIAAVERDIPQMFVPVHCPRCERIDLGRAAQIAELRRAPLSTRDVGYAAD